ncbi:hypothetical protein LCGC14_3138960 [marine sediment metagenome]|uniref:Uncharacterized protein n=1 Tax=marine sediment metagenome TaxID=412755 RepID=A0A0F8YLT7_9ZZZZ
MKTAGVLPADPEHGFKMVTVKGFCVDCGDKTRWRYHGKPYCAGCFPDLKYRNRRPRRIECHK